MIKFGCSAIKGMLRHDRRSSSFQSIVGSLMWRVCVCVVVTNIATAIKTEDGFEGLHIFADEHSDLLGECRYEPRSAFEILYTSSDSQLECIQLYSHALILPIISLIAAWFTLEMHLMP
jgi:hypothetical protein